LKQIKVGNLKKKKEKIRGNFLRRLKVIGAENKKNTSSRTVIKPANLKKTTTTKHMYVAPDKNSLCSYMSSQWERFLFFK